jgi:DNA-binding IclR family transcriptional regulator
MNPFGGSGVIDAPLTHVSGDTEELWTAWRDACEDLRECQYAWFNASVESRGDAHAVAVAAADRESVAAQLLAGSVLADNQTT